MLGAPQPSPTQLPMPISLIYLKRKYQANPTCAVWLQSRADELREQVAAAERAPLITGLKQYCRYWWRRTKTYESAAADRAPQVRSFRLGAQTAEAKARMDRANDIIRVEGAGATKVESETVTDSCTMR